MATRSEEASLPANEEATLETRLKAVLEGLEREVRGGLSGLIITADGHILARMVRGNVDPRALATAGSFLLAGSGRVLSRFTREGVRIISIEGMDGAVLVAEPVRLAFEELAIVVLVPAAVNRLMLRVALDKAGDELRRLEPSRRRSS